MRGRACGRHAREEARYRVSSLNSIKFRAAGSLRLSVKARLRERAVDVRARVATVHEEDLVASLPSGFLREGADVLARPAWPLYAMTSALSVRLFS